jgi:hypothetical protein
MPELVLDPISVHGEITRGDDGTLVGRLVLEVAGRRIALQSKDPAVFTQMAHVAADMVAQRAVGVPDRRRPVVHEFPCPRCLEPATRLLLVATGGPEIAVQMCPTCAGEVVTPITRDGNGRLRCCGAGLDQRDTRTGEDIHFEHCPATREKA